MGGGHREWVSGNANGTSPITIQEAEGEEGEDESQMMMEMMLWVETVSLLQPLIHKTLPLAAETAQEQVKAQEWVYAFPCVAFSPPPHMWLLQPWGM